MRYYQKKRNNTSNPLGLQPLPLYFLHRKHMGRKGYLCVMVSFSSSVSRCDIGEVLPCNGGVKIIRKQTINPLGLQPLPLYFLYRKHKGRKGYPACVFFCVHFADAMKLHPFVWSYPTFGDILQHPWLAATPPIFSIRKTQGGKLLSYT